MKKKAPCGKIDRDDLPWCCHRRLGEWLPRLAAYPGGGAARMLLKSEPLTTEYEELQTSTAALPMASKAFNKGAL